MKREFVYDNDDFDGMTASDDSPSNRGEAVAEFARKDIGECQCQHRYAKNGKLYECPNVIQYNKKYCPNGIKYCFEHSKDVDDGTPRMFKYDLELLAQSGIYPEDYCVSNGELKLPVGDGPKWLEYGRDNLEFCFDLDPETATIH